MEIEVKSQEKKVLSVNELIASELRIGKYICLYQAPNKQVPWSISIDEYYKINKFITEFTNDTVDFLRQNDFLENDSDIESYSKLVRPSVALILYILFYRVIRIYRLLKENNPEELSLINTRYFPPPTSIGNLYSITRDSWEFNQFILNEILSDCEKIEFSDKNLLYPKDYWDFSHWSNYEGFGNSFAEIPKRNKIKTFLRNPRFALREKSFQLIYKASSLGKEIPVFSMGFNELPLLKNKFFWPFGKFSKLPQQLPIMSDNAKINKYTRDKFIELGVPFFKTGALNILKELNITPINEKYLNNISPLFFNLYPSNLLEKSKIYGNWCIENISKFKTKHYFTHDTAASDIGIYYNYAATKLGFSIWSQQHSAWGGYLANVPNIAEASISGADYYITSGWSHPEQFLPVWKKSAVPISSPYYSELEKFKLPVKNNKTILLLTGEIYEFQTLPAGCHYLDSLWFWVESIKEIIQGLASKDIHIQLKNYAPRVDKLLKQYGIVEQWLEAGGDKIQVLDIVEKGTARIHFKNVSATIWDMPSGGFIESILMGVPAFSFWNSNFIRAQSEANVEINDLINVGILNNNEEKMTSNILACLTQENWYNEPHRKKAINNFMNHYLKTNINWSKEWSKLVNDLNFSNGRK